MVVIVFVAGHAADAGFHPELVLDGFHRCDDARIVGFEKMKFENRIQRRIEHFIHFVNIFRLLIRLELQNVRSELPAALAVMGVLDVLRVPVHAQAGGEIRGAALGVLASCPRRLAYPNASFVLAEPRLEFDGTVTAVTERQQQAERMLDSLYYRIAEATGREADEVRDDARRVRTLTTAEAIGYGLIHGRVSSRDE